MGITAFYGPDLISMHGPQLPAQDTGASNEAQPGSPSNDGSSTTSTTSSSTHADEAVQSQPPGPPLFSRSGSDLVDMAFGDAFGVAVTGLPPWLLDSMAAEHAVVRDALHAMFEVVSVFCC